MIWLKPTSINYHESISRLLSKIFRRDIEVCYRRETSKDTQEFYFCLNSDESIRFILPKKGACHLLSYLSPTRFTSKVILFILKGLYKIRLLALIPMIHRFSATGLRDIEWKKYGWQETDAPKFFILIGTQKESQNAVIFLDDSQDPDNTLIVKVSLNKICNLKNEYNAGNAIEANQTKYVVFNSAEKYLSQKYSSGFRKIIDLNINHVDYLSRLILVDNRKLGSVLKYNLMNSLDLGSQKQILKYPILQVLIRSIGNSSLFFSAHVHGDFSPFNIIYDRKFEKFVTIDWENADLNGVALSDMFNYVYIKDCLFSRSTSSDLDSFLYKMAQRYFSNIGYKIDYGEFYEYKILSVVTEFLRRLKDAGPDDVYVKYLYGIMNSEYKKDHLKSRQSS